MIIFFKRNIILITYNLHTYENLFLRYKMTKINIFYFCVIENELNIY